MVKGSLSVERVALPDEKGSLSVERVALPDEKGSLSVERVASPGEKGSLSVERVPLPGEKGCLLVERVALPGEKGSQSVEGVPLPDEKGCLAVAPAHSPVVVVLVAGVVVVADADVVVVTPQAVVLVAAAGDVRTSDGAGWPGREEAMTRRYVPGAALLTVLLLAGTARADIPPDPDSAEAHCTLAEQCPDGVECPAGIRRDAGEVRACEEAAEAKGLRKRCQHGLYLGTALYCRPDAHGSWSPPATVGGGGGPSEPASSGSTGSHGGCSRCAVSPDERAPSWIAGMAGAAIALLGLVRRRRPAR